MTTVLITGTNSGIGRSTAIRLASEGQRVYAAMRDTGKADKLLSLAKEAGAEVFPIALDVNDPDSVERATKHVVDDAGAVDVLINNAGVAMNATVEDVDIEAAKTVFETNYWGVIRCIQAVLPAMRERRSGHIINVSSVAGRLASPGQPIYSSSKWALECLSENLVHEVSPFGIRVSIIEPGVTRTAILPKNVGHPEPTAYETIYRRMLQFYMKGIEANVSADHVADTIWRAMNDASSRLRYPCSWGGEEISAGRATLSDEDWVSLGRIESDDDYYVAFASHFGVDLK